MHTERGFDRLVNFSDAVVAIAITLLILPLVDTATEYEPGKVAELLEQGAPRLLVFVISFVVIGRFWLAHHGMYEKVVGYNREVLLVNLLWLLSIVFLPFPTELIASAGQDDPTTTALYVGTMVVTSLSGVWQQWVFVRHPELQAPEVRGTLRMGTALISGALMVTAFLLVVLVPSGGLLWLFLLLLTGPLQLAYNRRQRSKNPGTVS